MKFDANFCQFAHADGRISTFITNPVEDSLNKLKRKLMNSLLFEPGFRKEDENLYFITLTVDEQHYDDVFINHSAGATMRKFMTLQRNWFRRGCKSRKPTTFDAAWRLERGSNGTKRLHYHMILKTGATLPAVTSRFVRTWTVCQWDKLDLEKSFQKLDDANLASIYVSKYASANDKRKGGEKIQSPAQTRNEQRSRIWSASRAFIKMPKSHRLNWDPDTKIWSRVPKNHYKLVPDTEFPVEWPQKDWVIWNGFTITSDAMLKFIHDCRRDCCVVQGRLFRNMDPVKLVRVRSMRGLKNTKDLNNRIASIFTEESEFDGSNEISEPDAAVIIAKAQDFWEKFSYETAPTVKPCTRSLETELRDFTKNCVRDKLAERVAIKMEEELLDDATFAAMQEIEMFYKREHPEAQKIQLDDLGGIFALKSLWI